MKPQQLAAIAALSTLSLVVACSGGNGGGAGQPGAGMLPVSPMAAGGIDAVADAKSKIKATPSKLAFTAVGKSAAKKVAISEKNYTGAFDVVSTCGKNVTTSPKKIKGPSASLLVTPLDAATCTLTISDTAKNKATIAVSVKPPVVAAIVNGNFATGKLAPWTPCSFTHAGLAAPINASPEPMGTAAQPTTATAPISVANVTKYGNSVGTPPPNLNPNNNGASPSGLSANAAMTGDQYSQQIGASGICQTFTVPASATNLSFYAYEGGSEYSFGYTDQEATILDSTGTTIQKTLFAEDNCFWDPGKVGYTGYTDSGCIPAQFGSTSTYTDWQGGYWVQRGPYNLSAYAGKSITLFLGVWASPTQNQITPYPDTYSQEMWVTNVQMSSSSTFPTTFGPNT